MNKPLIASTIIGLALVGGAVIAAQGRGGEQAAQNVSMQGDTQIVEVSAKGGYSPKVTTAKAGVPTTLRLTTDGTYDCSAAVTIPSLGFRKTLDSTGVTEVQIPAQESGKTIQGVCAMGMYNFSIRFL